jgi:hypothetical protein
MKKSEHRLLFLDDNIIMDDPLNFILHKIHNL